MKILELFAEDRPRERMMMKGAESLSTAELLAIMLRTGTSGVNVIDVARELLSAADGSLCALSRMGVDKLRSFKGIGDAKAVTLAACFALAGRLAAEKDAAVPLVVRNADDAYLAVRKLFGGGETEECWCVFLKRSQRVISSLRISTGGETFTDLNIKKVVRSALDCGASAIIVAHNHPSGNPHPSNADLVLTTQLRRALDTFDLTLLDHLILSEGGYYSFAEERVFPAGAGVIQPDTGR